MKSGEALKRGDVIAVDRGAYKHFAVYVGEGEVIQYSAKGRDFGGNITVHRATMLEFLKGSKEFSILAFPEEKEKPITFKEGLRKLLKGDIFALFHQMRRVKNYHLYTPEETVKRAESRLGEASYNLVTDNCEHFAIWCKTGVSESRQVNAVLERLEQIIIPW